MCLFYRGRGKIDTLVVKGLMGERCKKIVQMMAV